jgi:uncharacterized protein (TIGR02594 family)
MTITRIITDVPREQVNFVISLIHADGGTFEQKDEADGEVTIIATFPDFPQVAPVMAAAGTSEFKWMKIARDELGQAEIPGSASNKRILAYNATTHGGAESDSIPWCSSFVNFCVTQAGFIGTNSKSARSWLEWGVEAEDFLPGCVVVLNRGEPPKGHVGFYVGRESGRIRLLGGNQGDKVSIASYDADRVVGRRVLRA